MFQEATLTVSWMLSIALDICDFSQRPSLPKTHLKLLKYRGKEKELFINFR
jgi:hypothetical protein